MKITFVLPFAGLAGGIRVVAIYADHLKQRGHDVLLVSQPPRQMKLRDHVKHLLKQGSWSPEQEGSHLDTLDVPHRMLESRRPVVDRDLPDADVVVATWWETAEWVAKLHPSKGAKAYFIQQYEANFGAPIDRVDATWRAPMQKIACAAWLGDFARTRFDDPNCIVIPNRVDLSLFHAPLRGKQQAPTVGCIYAGNHAKGFDVTTKALKLMRDRVPNMTLVVFGARKPSRDLPLPAGASFHYQPRQEMIRELYAHCDVWLCGSRSEGFHLPPLEAMACRCPVVSTRVGGPADVIEDGSNGYLVDVEDATGLAQGAVRVLEMSDAQWRKLSDGAYATAERWSSWTDAGDCFERALEQAMSAPGRPSAVYSAVHQGT